MRPFSWLCSAAQFAVVVLAATCACAQTAVMHGEIPAVECSGRTEGHEYFWAIERLDSKGKPLFRIPVSHLKGGGWKFGTLRVTADRIAFDADPSDGTGPFDEDRTAAAIKYEESDSWLGWSVRAANKNYNFAATGGSRDSGKLAVYWRLFPECHKLTSLALSDFEAAQREFDRLTAVLNAPPKAQGAPSPPPAPAPPRLAFSLQPANVQVYVDDVFKGMASAEGRLVIEGLAPGTHRVRMNLIGYTESARTVELKPGETATIEAKLEAAGPKPLALAEIEEALSNGLPPRGITKLVKQYGVDFALTKPIEEGLREKGADSDLLLAIATNKK